MGHINEGRPSEFQLEEELKITAQATNPLITSISKLFNNGNPLTRLRHHA